MWQAFAFAVTLLTTGIAYGQTGTLLRLQSTIVLPGVQGRIDHMAFDRETGRLFVAALGNNTVEVIDVKQSKRLQTISGLHEPQGVLYLPDVHRLYVANGDDGTVKVFDARNYQLWKTVSLGSDADNIRFDPERKQIYVGYGSGALAVLDENGTKVGNIALTAHPESFQLERNGSRIFVNLPDSRNIAVVNRDSSAVTANWKTDGALANFPMALDEQDHRLFVVCRQPAVLLVFDTDTGAVIAKLPAVGDCDDVFYDSGSKRIYASGGEGAVSIFEQQSPDQYRELGKVRTRKGARTSFFSSEFRSLYVAARQQNGAPTAIYVYSVP